MYPVNIHALAQFQLFPVHPRLFELVGTSFAGRLVWRLWLQALDVEWWQSRIDGRVPRMQTIRSISGLEPKKKKVQKRDLVALGHESLQHDLSLPPNS